MSEGPLAVESTLQTWVKSQGFDVHQWTALPSDAGFRRYYRFKDARGQSRIAVYAPPETEDNAAFRDLSQLLRQAQIGAPEIYAAEWVQGFLILSDLGTERYDRRLFKYPDRVDETYEAAFQTLALFQNMAKRFSFAWRAYDRGLMGRELDLFPDWFLKAYCQDHLGQQGPLAHFQSNWARIKQTILDMTIPIPRVLVHRDFQSRNLLWLGNEQASSLVGILDFQDAMIGPVTYDVVSLIWDCYLDWPEGERLRWAKMAYDILQPADERGKVYSWDHFLSALWVMGLVRHIKNVGIFSRLFLRDGKSEYLAYIPRTWGYVRQFAGDLPGMQSLLEQMALWHVS